MTRFTLRSSTTRAVFSRHLCNVEYSSGEQKVLRLSSLEESFERVIRSHYHNDNHIKEQGGGELIALYPKGIARFTRLGCLDGFSSVAFISTLSISPTYQVCQNTLISSVTSNHSIIAISVLFSY